MSKEFRVLVTNDDGPPSEAHSPFVLPFVRTLQTHCSWKPRSDTESSPCFPAASPHPIVCSRSVFLPATQQSWISKAHQIHGDIKLSYYDPEGGTVSPIPSENHHWNLLDATPGSTSIDTLSGTLWD